VEVRLDSVTSGLVATAYTMGTSEFEFRDVTLDLSGHYVLVINDPEFDELRYPLRMSDLRSDGLIMLFLERRTDDAEPGFDRSDGPLAVDVRQLTAEIPEEARRAHERGLGALEAGDDAGGRAELERAVGLAPDYYDALNRLGAEYLRAGLLAEAEPVLLRARDLGPNDPLPLTNLGSLYFQAGEAQRALSPGQVGESPDPAFLKAVDVLEEAVRLDPLLPRAHYYLGAALYRVGAQESAEARLLDALGLDPTLHEARLTLLNVYTRSGRYPDALDQISAYLEADPNTPQRAQLEALRVQIEIQMERLER
jgi:tetratricopeptide (TPR) repeat protein